MVTDPSVSYRPGRAEDAPALVDMVARCDDTILDWAPEGYVLPAADFAEDAAKLAERLADPSTWMAVAVDARGAPVGFATIVTREAPGRGYISNLFVDPPAWGAGIGRALLARAEQGIRERGFTVGELNTQELNTRARRLYERAGWSDTGGRHPHRIDGLVMVEYEKELGG
jgi:GNAT superfamily N-acetyltransferase